MTSPRVRKPTPIKVVISASRGALAIMVGEVRLGDPLMMRLVGYGGVDEAREVLMKVDAIEMRESRRGNGTVRVTLLEG